MNKSLVNILSDPVLLNEYIQSLENDIDNTEKIDEKTDAILDNILTNLSEFKDRRALRSSTIDAVTNLLRFKSELPQKRIQTKKTILDIACKKEELAIKKSMAVSSEALANNTGNLLQLLFTNLDTCAINPVITEAEISSDDYKEIIDGETEKLVEIDDMEEVKITDDIREDILNKMESTDSATEIIELQKQLDTVQDFVLTTGDNDNGEQTENE